MEMQKGEINIKRLVIKKTINIGTWNVRGFNGKEVELTEEIDKTQMRIVRVTETKKKGKGWVVLQKGYTSIWWCGVRKI